MEVDWGSDLKARFEGCAKTCIHKSHSMFQADLYHVVRQGRHYVIKDFSSRPLLLRRLFLRWCARHEYQTMVRLADIKNIPSIYTFPDADVLIMDFVHNKGTLPSHKDTDAELPALEFFKGFRRLVADMHDAGVAHGDIRRRNVLVTEKGLVLLDFATAISRAGAFRPIRRLLFKIIAPIDVRKALEFQSLYCPGTLTDDELALLKRQGILLRAGRWLRRNVYRRLIKRRRWKQRGEKFRALVDSFGRENDSDGRL